MARDAGEPSAKRAKVDETEEKEEEDALVRRKEEVVRLLEIARRPFPPARKGEGKSKREKERKRKGIARTKQELLTLCERLEAKNEKLLGRLLPELWQKIVDEYLDQNDLPALAMTCRFFREKQKDLGKKVKTTLNFDSFLELRESGKVAPHSLGWFRWVCDTFEILPGYKRIFRVQGAVYKGDLVNYSALQGSVKILRWLMEEKGFELNGDTDWWAGSGGSVEILEYLEGRGYKFTEAACGGAARGGRLEALKFLRGLDPPCPWNEWTCADAAQGGHLDVLKWARSQDPPCPWDKSICDSAALGGHLEVLKFLRAENPPCPWDEETCAWAAKGGHLDVLKWARSQDPPCPWNEGTCEEAAGRGHLDVLKWARDQDPPCPWRRGECKRQASRKSHGHIVEWIKWAHR